MMVRVDNPSVTFRESLEVVDVAVLEVVPVPVDRVAEEPAVAVPVPVVAAVFDDTASS